MNRSEFLQAVQDSVRPIYGLGVHNALTANFGKKAGFDLLWLSSLEVSASRMRPDENMISFDQMSEIVSDISLAVDLPLLVDADNGYGTHELACMAARKFFSAGALGMCMEDYEFPKRNSFDTHGSRMLLPAAVFADRIAHVRNAAKDLLLVARTEALVAGMGAEEAIARATHYHQSGADLVFIQSSRETTEEYFRCVGMLDPAIPLLLTPTALPDASPGQLFSLGVKVLIHSNAVIRLISGTLARTLPTLLADGRLASVEDGLYPLEDLLAMLKPTIENPVSLTAI